jgi:hypothetical protein
LTRRHIPLTHPSRTADCHRAIAPRTLPSLEFPKPPAWDLNDPFRSPTCCLSRHRRPSEAGSEACI